MQLQTNESAAPISLAKGVDVGKVEKELKALWRTDQADASGVTRACAMNLVVYATPEDHSADLEDMLLVVNTQHPGRVLLLVSDANAATPQLEATASVRCRQLGAHQIICGEQVTIQIAGSARDTVSTAVAPLLMPDVPTFLWWKDIPHQEDKLFNRLADLADRIVIDSAAFDNPHEDTRRLTSIIHSYKDFGYFSDLNWGRLTSWRTLLASFWDVSDYRPHLDNIDRITVEYDPPDVNKSEIPAQPLLVIGWLASRLGWRVVKGERGTEATWFTLCDGGREIVVEMRPDKDLEDNDGLLISLSLAAHQGQAEFCVSFNPDGPKLETSARVDGQRTVGRVLTYEQKSEAQRLARELGLLRRDAIYEETLGVVADLLAAIK